MCLIILDRYDFWTRLYHATLEFETRSPSQGSELTHSAGNAKMIVSMQLLSVRAIQLWLILLEVLLGVIMARECRYTPCFRYIVCATSHVW